MRNRKRNRRSPSCETREAIAMMPSPSPFPDAEPKKTDGQVGGSGTTGRKWRSAVTLLTYLSLPVVVFLAFPEPFQPFCMLAAVFSGHKVLSFDGASQ
jgi:hypothetical protein